MTINVYEQIVTPVFAKKVIPLQNLSSKSIINMGKEAGLQYYAYYELTNNFAISSQLSGENDSNNLADT